MPLTLEAINTGDPTRTSFARTATNFARIKTAVDGLESRMVPSFDVRRFGAIGDGVTHPLSASFGTLAAARAVYPHAVALTDELDWAASVAAINAARAAGGGTVFWPEGTFVMNNAASAQRFLRIPEARPSGWTRGTQVNLLGEGRLLTRLRWTHDAGAGLAAVTCGDPAGNRANDLGRYAPDGMYEGLISDIGFEGPDRDTAETAALGTLGALMDGIRWGARRRLVDVEFQGFRAGVNIVGDHAVFTHVVTPRNYYGVYWDDPSEHLYGDVSHYKCMYTGLRMAALAVHPRAILSGQFHGGAPTSAAPPTASSRRPAPPTGRTCG